MEGYLKSSKNRFSSRKMRKIYKKLKLRSKHILRTFHDKTQDTTSVNVFNIIFCSIIASRISYFYCGKFLKCIRTSIRMLWVLYRFFWIFCHFHRDRYNFFKLLDILSRVLNVLSVSFLSGSFRTLKIYSLGLKNLARYLLVFLCM
jgi:hypothetical protein